MLDVIYRIHCQEWAWPALVESFHQMVNNTTLKDLGTFEIRNELGPPIEISTRLKSIIADDGQYIMDGLIDVYGVIGYSQAMAESSTYPIHPTKAPLRSKYSFRQQQL